MDSVLKVLRRDGLSGRSCGLIFTKLGNVAQRRSLVRKNCVTPSLIFLNPETSMHDANERNELGAVVFYKQDVAITDLEFRRISYLHRLGADRSAQHLQRHTRSRIALNGFFYFNSDVAHDVTLRALTGPFGADASYSALKNHFGPTHQIIKRRRDNSGGQSGAGHN